MTYAKPEVTVLGSAGSLIEADKLIAGTPDNFVETPASYDPEE